MTSWKEVKGKKETGFVHVHVPSNPAMCTPGHQLPWSKTAADQCDSLVPFPAVESSGLLAVSVDRDIVATTDGTTVTTYLLGEDGASVVQISKPLSAIRRGKIHKVQGLCASKRLGIIAFAVDGHISIHSLESLEPLSVNLDVKAFDNFASIVGPGAVGADDIMLLAVSSKRRLQIVRLHILDSNGKREIHHRTKEFSGSIGQGGIRWMTTMNVSLEGEGRLSIATRPDPEGIVGCLAIRAPEGELLLNVQTGHCAAALMPSGNRAKLIVPLQETELLMLISGTERSSTIEYCGRLVRRPSLDFAQSPKSATIMFPYLIALYDDHVAVYHLDSDQPKFKLEILGVYGIFSDSFGRTFMHHDSGMMVLFTGEGRVATARFESMVKTDDRKGAAVLGSPLRMLTKENEKTPAIVDSAVPRPKNTRDNRTPGKPTEKSEMPHRNNSGPPSKPLPIPVASKGTESVQCAASDSSSHDESSPSLRRGLSHLDTVPEDGTASASESSGRMSVGERVSVINRVSLSHSPVDSEDYDITIFLPGGDKTVVSISKIATVEDLHNVVFAKLAPMPQFGGKDMDKYKLKVSGILKEYDGQVYLEDVERSSALSEVDYFQFCKKTSQRPKLTLLEQKSVSLKKSLSRLREKEDVITEMVGKAYIQTKEMVTFRKNIARYLDELEKRGLGVEPEEGVDQDLRKRLLLQSEIERSTRIQPSEVICRVHYIPPGSAPMSKVMKFESVEIISTVIEKSIEKFEILFKDLKKWSLYGINAAEEMMKTSDFMLKVSGSNEYMASSESLGVFTYVQQCLRQDKFLEFVLVPKPALSAGRAEGHRDAPSSAVESTTGKEDLMKGHVKMHDHDSISLSANDHFALNSISLWDIKTNFRVRIRAVDRLSGYNYDRIMDAVSSSGGKAMPLLYVTAAIYRGGNLICKSSTTHLVPMSPTTYFNQWLTFEYQTRYIPWGSRLCFSVYCKPGIPVKDVSDDKVISIGWVNVPILDHEHSLLSGCIGQKLWPDADVNPIGASVQNSAGKTSLFFELDEYVLPVVYPSVEDAEDVQIPPDLLSPSEIYMNRILATVARDALCPITQDEKQLLWKYRYALVNNAKALPKVLLSVPDEDLEAQREVSKLLSLWERPCPTDALELLDAYFADFRVREYAVECLEGISDGELRDYMLQLVQVLRFEAHHDSSLARFLLRRALKNPVLIGHFLYWYLKAELHDVEVSERFSVILEAYITRCGKHQQRLQRQNQALGELMRVAYGLKQVAKTERKSALQQLLSNVELPDEFELPLSGRFLAKGLVVEKCKYMDSAKLPLWLVFENADPTGSPVYALLKAGDDLKQDLLSLQMIRIMDKLWRSEGMDLRMTPYGCISTGNKEGLLEVVLNAETTANITMEAGGARAAFSDRVIADWLKKFNPTKEKYDDAVENFICSCAGYCVASYVLGLGDRHNDNIMMTKDGRFLHIDFGHFLGNVKKFLGMNRDKAPFVFTPEFLYVMGGKDSPGYFKFVNFCVRAYNALRKHAHLFINLFAMMLSTGIPELKSAEDIGYMRAAFTLGKTEKEACDFFVSLINESLNTSMTRINNYIHIMAHQSRV